MASISEPPASGAARPGRGLLLLVLGTFLLLSTGVFVAWLYRTHETRKKVGDLVARGVEQRDLFQRPSEAVTLFKAALAEDGDAWPALYELGCTYLALDKAYDAATALEQALLRAPVEQRAVTQLALGNAYRMRYTGSGSDNDYQLALASFDDARRKPELEAEALMHSGMLALRARKFREARSYFELLLERHPDYENRAQVEKGLDLAQEIAR